MKIEATPMKISPMELVAGKIGVDRLVDCSSVGPFMVAEKRDSISCKDLFHLL